MTTNFRQEEEKRFVEEGANLEHYRWARWQEYLHSKCIENPDGSLTIPTASVLHWKRQIGTHYDHLSEEEKESDRKEVRNYLPLLRAHDERLIEKLLSRWPEEEKNTSLGYATLKEAHDYGFNVALATTRKILEDYLT